MERKTAGERAMGYRYSFTRGAGDIVEFHYAIVCGRTVIRTQRLSKSQALGFPGARWSPVSGVSPKWVIANCVCLGYFPNPLRKS